MGCTRDHQLPAHLLEVFLLGAHGEGRGVLEDRDAPMWVHGGTHHIGAGREQPGLTFSRTRVGREAPAVP